ncbi:hypothetical protein QWJ90_01240 [Microbacterium oryzae]|uniref:hypothetical protein n=1 Tax=Microbacterium oryzae TaxID=743009 RepID=UPI0025B08560|nr:hypothetical protein [Microbacterium oryzae]MDN3309546.1 hypothetical protein [Microbacterium oryzae]
MRALKRLGRATIWHKDAIPASEGELARDVKRWVLPPIDALLILGSAVGLTGGLPSVAIVYNEAVSYAAAVAVLVFAAACLVGVSFPKLWVLEFASKCGLVAVLITYAALLFGLALEGSQSRGFVSGVTAACAVVPMWRIVWLLRERRRRVRARRLGQVLAAQRES